MIPDRQNPLFGDDHDPVVDPDAIRQAHIVLKRERYRDIRDLRRKETATEAVAGLDLDGREIFGLTKGQFSLIDIIEALLAISGPAALATSVVMPARMPTAGANQAPKASAEFVRRLRLRCSATIPNTMPPTNRRASRSLRRSSMLAMRRGNTSPDVPACSKPALSA